MVQIGTALLAEIERRLSAVEIAPSLKNAQEEFADVRADR
jgi:hypothetical protein